MNRNRERDKDYTHKAWFYKIPCYYDIRTDELWGRNALFAKMLDVAVWYHVTFKDEDFPILLKENDLDKQWKNK